MNHVSSPVAAFFQSYERNITAGDDAAVAAQFAEVFMAAGPGGAQSIRSSDFALALPKRKQLFESFGCRSTSLISCEETQLDARFAMVETRWQMTFVREGKEAKVLMADSLFIVDICAEAMKIVFYLAHQDPIDMLRA
jgi:hypothetical protein